MSTELDRSVFISLYFATVIALQSKVVSLAPNPQPAKPDFCIYIPQEHDGTIIPVEIANCSKFVWFSSVSDSTSISYDRFLPNPIQFTIHQSSHHSMLYSQVIHKGKKG
jgi:hypothetical protein